MAEIAFNKQEEKLEATLKITIKPEDYKPKLEEKLKEHQKKANIPGFRPGKAPKGVLQKMIGKDLKREVVPQLLQDEMESYLKKEDIQTISRPVILTEHDEESWKNNDVFTWEIKIGLRPDVTIDYAALNNTTRYKVRVDDELLNKNIRNILEDNGSFEDLKSIDEGRDDLILHTHWTELDDNQKPLEEGISKDAHFRLTDINEKARKVFIGKKPEEEIPLQLFDVFETSELVKILGIEENAARDLHPHFNIRVNRVFYKKPAEANQELFDKILGPGEADSEETFRGKYKERLESFLEERSDAEAFERLRQKLMEVHNISLPRNFIWENFVNDRKEQNPEVKEDDLTGEFPKLLDYAQWSVIADALVKENEISIENEELVEQAKADLHQMIQSYYGFAPDPESKEFQNALVKYIKNEESISKANAKVRDSKIFRVLKEKVAFEEKEVSLDAFKKTEEETFKSEAQEEPAADVNPK